MSWKFELGQRVKVIGVSAHAGLVGIVIARTELISGKKTYRVTGGADGVGVNEDNLYTEDTVEVDLKAIQAGLANPLRSDRQSLDNNAES